ncbi:uncharacterized protein LOC123218913 [Mangifera indica]|uniref:uncharacterized protein LOC123218913 n=1 Tax=Mangifera indica TaxID=29780 RepID=UPI001CFC2F88|nr:uncharacterized protein LOC123218913 [Mangifera indica]
MKNNKAYKLSEFLTREDSVSYFSKDQDNYHGEVSVSIPFTWESQPGTPKICFRENPLPPLAPPPSYFYNSPKKSSIEKPNPNKSNRLGTIIPNRVTRKSTQLSTSPSSSSSSSYSSMSSYSVPSSPKRSSTNFQGRCEQSSPRLSADSRALGEEEEYESHVSTLCFARVPNCRSKAGCYSSIIKVLLRDS